MPNPDRRVKIVKKRGSHLFSNSSDPRSPLTTHRKLTASPTKPLKVVVFREAPVQTKNMNGHPNEESVKQVEQDTYAMLDDIGVPYKRVSRYMRIPRAGTAVWIGETDEAGTIELFLGAVAEDVAHEIGHGFHERLRKNRSLQFPFREPQDGEAVAEAIRFFVEQRRGSSWQPDRNKQTLEHCRYNFEEFKALCREIDQLPQT